MPAPVPHYDRPAITGTLLRDGDPVPGRTLKAFAIEDRAPDNCRRNGITASTDEQGRFELGSDRDLITAWWGQGGYNGVALCLLDAREESLRRTFLTRDTKPPFLPAHIVLRCVVDHEDKLTCVRDFKAEEHLEADAA